MFGQIYRMNQERIVEMLDGTDTSTTVPACPDWSVADVVRHLTGLAGDVVGGNVEGYGSDAWTDAQIVAREEVEYEDVVAEWNRHVDELATILDDVDASELPAMIMAAVGLQPRTTFPVVILGDLLHHEFDLRNAIGNREDRDRPDVIGAGVGHAKALRSLFKFMGLPTLRIMVDGNEINVGRDAPEATVHMSAFEAFRSIGGRRTLEQMNAYDWEGPADTFLPHLVLPPLKAAATSIGEQ